MPYLKSEMRYRYLWLEKADYANTYYRSGQDHTHLNRTYGYEMLFFINHIASVFGWPNYPTALYVKLEKLIKDDCPRENASHKSVENWIRNNWDKY